MAVSDEAKARAYDLLTGGVDIPVEQKAERWDRKAAAWRAKWRANGDTGSYTFSGPDHLWCACGRLTGHEGACKGSVTSG